MNKSDLVKALLVKTEIINKIENIQISILKLSKEFHVFTCAECGNPFVLNEGQYDRRFNKDFMAKCSAGHANIWRR